MAITRTLTKAVPYNKDNKVEQWDLTMKYEQGTEGQADYFTSDMTITLPAALAMIDIVNFTPKAEGEWTLAQLTALCPIAQWDTTFASQYDSVITNPPDNPVADTSFVIPS